MRLVLDTNVVVSALLTPYGAPARVLDLVLAGEHIVLLDDRIRAEYAEVLARPRFGFASHGVAALLGFLSGWGESVAARPLDLQLSDPDDLPFLEVAVAGRADALITGNTRHFVVPQTSPSLRLLTPAQFLAME